MPELTYDTWRVTRNGSPFDPSTAAVHYPPDLDLEPIHLQIDLTVDLEVQSLMGMVTIRVQARRNGVQKLELDAIELEIRAVEDTEDRPLSWRYDGKKLSIDWKEPFVRDEQRQVRVTYRVADPVDGLYFSKPTTAVPQAAWYAVTDHETERARHWLPCVDLPHVRTTLEINLRTDSRFVVLANGYLAGEAQHDDGTKTVQWRLEQRCPSYLICIAIGDFVRADDGEFHDGEKSIPIAYFCTREHNAADLMRSFGQTKTMLHWMTQKLDLPFPYPKYFQLAVPGIGGAMENISLVSWDERFVLDETLATEWTWLLDAINVHEMAHSYFGDAVVCRDFAHAWLKESWATYIEQVWREDNGSLDEACLVFDEHACAYFDEADNHYSRPIVTRHFQSSWDMYDRHLYPGGACRLHMLRCELGDEVFWPAVSDYLRRNDGKVVETDDFRLVLEEHSGRSLGYFFDQWFYTAGYPEVNVTFTYSEEAHEGTFIVEQRQVGERKNGTPFSFSTQLGWTIAGEPQTRPIKVEKAREIYIVPMTELPEQVRFDPKCRVLCKLSFNPGDDLLRRQLTHAQDALGRVQAARELVKTGQRSNIQAVADAYPSEPFWGARCAMAEALGKANTEAAIEIVARLIAEEEDPLVLPAVLAAAGKYRDIGIRDALFDRLDRGLAYVAKGAAYRSLGEQRANAPYDRLVEAAQEPGFNGVVQNGALHGLAATRRDEAADILVDQTRIEIGAIYVRPSAVAALAELAQGQEKRARERAVEVLTDLLRDPTPRVALAAVHALGKLRATASIPALEAFARARAHQDGVVALRVIHAMRRKESTGEAALQGQIEALQARVRALADEVDQLRARVPANKTAKAT